MACWTIPLWFDDFFHEKFYLVQGFPSLPLPSCIRIMYEQSQNLKVHTMDINKFGQVPWLRRGWYKNDMWQNERVSWNMRYVQQVYDITIGVSLFAKVNLMNFDLTGWIRFSSSKVEAMQGRLIIYGYGSKLGYQMTHRFLIMFSRKTIHFGG